MADFSPGPWMASPTDRSVVVDCNGSEVAAIYGDDNPENWAEADANIRLISASPVMFLQGRFLVAALERYGFPVSNAALPSLRENGSVEANALHDAAFAFRATLSLEKD